MRRKKFQEKTLTFTGVISGKQSKTMIFRNGSSGFKSLKKRTNTNSLRPARSDQDHPRRNSSGAAHWQAYAQPQSGKFLCRDRTGCFPRWKHCPRPRRFETIPYCRVACSIEFVNEAYKHCKTIAASGAGVYFVEHALTTAHKTDEDQEGLITDNGISISETASAFIEAMAAHRHWTREKSLGNN